MFIKDCVELGKIETRVPDGGADSCTGLEHLIC